MITAAILKRHFPELAADPYMMLAALWLDNKWPSRGVLRSMLANQIAEDYPTEPKPDPKGYRVREVMKHNVDKLKALLT